MIGYVVANQYIAPQPSSAAVEMEHLRTAALLAARPKTIRIPAIKVFSPVNSVGLNSDHTMEVPHPGPLYNQPAWYRNSPTPGERGASVIVGHVDSAKGPSVFFNLGALRPGQRIEITRADGIIAIFAVDHVASFPKDSFPTRAVYGSSDYSALRLVTCGGSFDKATGNYRNDVVVFAHLVEPLRA
jgi:sortase (surface protein transpeptidase)